MSTEILNQHRANASDKLSRIAQMAITHKHQLNRFIWRYEHNSQDIEDIVQEAFLEAFQSCHGIQEDQSVESWFFGVAANVARQHVAKQCRKNKFIVQLDDDAMNAYFETMRDQTNTQDIFERKEHVEAIRKHLSSLTQDLQDCFEIIFVQGKSYQDAADIMHVPIGTIRSRVHRIRKTLVH